MVIKNIKDFNYFITTCGKVFNSKGLEIKQQRNRDGYWTVNLRRDGKYFHLRVNRLVAQTFIPNPKNLPVVNHIDHDRGNNNVSNLEWVTHSENQNKSIENNWMAGKKRSKLNVEQVKLICEMIQDGYRNKEIREKLNVTQDEVIGIRTGKTWREISKEYKLIRHRRGISEDSVRWICRKLREGLKVSEVVRLASSESITRSVVTKIKNKKTFINISKDYF